MISVRTKISVSVMIACLALPQAVLARDVEACANLYRRLASTPQIIGTTRNVRNYALDLSAMNSDIRRLRIDMRQIGCGGSIVTLGGNNHSDDQCHDMQDKLQRLEDDREKLAEQRNNSRSLLQPSEERVSILSAIRENNCTPTDLDTQAAIDEKERVRIRGIALPGPDENQTGAGLYEAAPHMPAPAADKANSSITHIGSPQPVATQKEAPIQFPPDRPYDPDKKVRVIGPRFLPDEKIDLANPKSSGPQPQQ